ncbi:MAG: helix-turn-helix domain-containing protein [candidate division Zixibacteria bacterium]|nr:helix-turn-helix domain-containing protein [candidate division Zixibacteria bacterium]
MPKLNDAQRQEIVDYWMDHKDLSYRDIGKAVGRVHQTVMGILQPLKAKANELVARDLEDKLKLFIKSSVKEAEHFATIFKRDIAVLEEQIKGLEDLPLDMDNLKLKQALTKERNDLIYRTGSNQIALVNTLKPLGITNLPFWGGAKTNPTANLYQFFIKVDGTSASDIDESFRLALELKKRQEAFASEEAEFEVVDNDE